MLPIGGSAPVAAVLLALLPPLVAALFALSLVRLDRSRPGLELLEQRLTTANASASALVALLASVDERLASCVSRTTQLADSASDQDNGLLASATLLTAAAAEMEQSGAETDGVAKRLIALMPDLQRLSSEINALAGRLDGDTPRQLQVIDALLASIQIRGDEIAAQADTAIISMNQQLADVDEQSRQTTTRIAKRAYALDAAVDGASERAGALLTNVGEQITVQMTALDDRLAATRTSFAAAGDVGAAVIGRRIDGLLEAAGELSAMLTTAEGQSGRLRQSTDEHFGALPEQLLHARREGETMFNHLSERADALRSEFESLGAPLSLSRTMVEAMLTRMDDVRAVAATIETTLETGLPAATLELNKLGDGLAGLTAGVAALEDGLVAREQATRAINVLIGETRVELAAMGETDLRLVDDRLNATAVVMRDISRQITAIVPLSDSAKSQVEGDLASLNDRLRAMQHNGSEMLAALSTEVGAVHGAATDLSGPLATAKSLLGDLNAEVDRIDASAEAAALRIYTRVELTIAAFGALKNSARALLDETTALEGAVGRGSRDIDTASEDFARERATFTTASATLGAEFDRARGVLDEISATSSRLATETAANLAPAFEHARQLADTAEATLREMLTAVITDAEDRLKWSGGELANAAFGTPIRLELAAIEDTANRAVVTAEKTSARIAGQARALSSLIDGVDTKVAEIETRLDVRSRDTLSTRSTRLIAMLGDASVDIARLLAVNAGEKAWLAYRKGDRSIFARLTVRLIDRQTSAKIARHFAHDPAFNEEASHYLTLFERLTSRLDSDPDGDALLATVVSSDLGKLYVAIARATGRWQPTA